MLLPNSKLCKKVASFSYASCCAGPGDDIPMEVAQVGDQYTFGSSTAGSDRRGRWDQDNLKPAFRWRCDSMGRGFSFLDTGDSEKGRGTSAAGKR